MGHLEWPTGPMGPSILYQLHLIGSSLCSGVYETIFHCAVGPSRTSTGNPHLTRKGSYLQESHFTTMTFSKAHGFFRSAEQVLVGYVSIPYQTKVSQLVGLELPHAVPAVVLWHFFWEADEHGRESVLPYVSKIEDAICHEDNDIALSIARACAKGSRG